MNKYQSLARKSTPKNPLAARFAKQRYDNKVVEWTELTKAAKEDRLLDKWQIKYDQERNNFIETNIGTGFLEQASAGWLLHGLDESTIRKDMEKATTEAELTQAKKTAANNPEHMLDLLGSGEAQKRWPALNNPDYAEDVRSAAEGNLNFNRREEERRLSSLYGLAFTHAMNPDMTPSKFEALVRKTEGLTDEQRTRLVSLYNGALNTWNKTGFDPFTKTRDPIGYMQMMARVQAGENITVGHLEVGNVRPRKRPPRKHDRYRKTLQCSP